MPIVTAERFRYGSSAIGQGRSRTSPNQGDEITFTKHIAPILWQHCVRCHRPGEIGPFSLLTYKDAARRAYFLYEVAASGQMPPWKPHPGAGVFLDASRLSAAEIETLGSGPRPAVSVAILPTSPLCRGLPGLATGQAGPRFDNTRTLFRAGGGAGRIPLVLHAVSSRPRRDDQRRRVSPGQPPRCAP